MAAHGGMLRASSLSADLSDSSPHARRGIWFGNATISLILIVVHARAFPGELPPQRYERINRAFNKTILPMGLGFEITGIQRIQAGPPGGPVLHSAAARGCLRICSGSLR